jgi:uncharacterized membrane protein
VRIRIVAAAIAVAAALSALSVPALNEHEQTHTETVAAPPWVHEGNHPCDGGGGGGGCSGNWLR